MTSPAGDSLRTGLLGYWPGIRSPDGYLRDYSPEANHGIVGFDARWIWFTNPRAIHHVGDEDRTYFGYLGGPTGRDIRIGAYDHRSNTLTRTTVHASFSADDHTNPSLLVREDGHVLVFWTGHNGEEIFYRISVKSENVSQFGQRRTISQNVVTYPNPVQVSGDDGDTLYLFYRDREMTNDVTEDKYGYMGDGNVYYRRSFDGGLTWTDQREMVAAPAGHYSMYFVHAQADNGTIHFFFTDAERGGDAPKWHVLHCAYRDGTFYRADGSRMADEAELPLTRSELETVYDSATEENDYAWVWDCGVDTDGHPAVVYATFPSTLAHRYRYARWDGDGWHDHDVVGGGRYVEENGVELHYSAGIAMDSSDPDVLYACIHDDGYRGMKRLETNTDGRTWATRDVTYQSVGTTLRPVVPLNAADEIPVLWLAGTYQSMHSAGTVLRGLPHDWTDGANRSTEGNGRDGSTLVGDGTRGVSLGPHRFRGRALRDEVSVSALVCPDDPAKEGVIANVGGAIRLGFSRETSGSVEFGLSEEDDERTLNWEWSVRKNRHFVEGTWDGSEMQLLIDGEVVETQSFEGPLQFGTSPADWTLLRDAYLMGPGFRGWVKEVRLYNRSTSKAMSRRLSALAQNPSN